MDAGTLLPALLLVAIAYLAGSVPSGVLVARLSGGPDPRTIGSGRTGGTNALRALGRKRALVVVVMDLAKGALPVLLARNVTGDAVVEVACGVGAVLGASRSIFLRFGGGRGVGTGVGTMLVIQPLSVVVAFPVFAIAIAATRYVSVGSLLGSLAVVVTVGAWWATGGGAVPAAYPLYAAIGGALVWLAHADNIERLLRGEERKFDLGLLGGSRPKA
ncbi:MAG: glycerol-3-phosphate acyltransferase PlsY [Chloroflexota bacterium]|jgi:glycerol-3-phosphate acyltransferase PlsY